MNVLMTGATGFLGKAILSRLIFDDNIEKIYLLVRPSRTRTASERVEKMIEKMFPKGRWEYAVNKVAAVSGDLTKPWMGIEEAVQTRLIGELGQIIHVGASTDFGAPLEVARTYNVEGTREVLRLAQACKREGRLSRFDYVSTAFVAGTKAGRVTEEDLVRNQGFANTYEQTKFEAEVLVRSYMDEFDICIYRPSIVVGDSHHGYTPHFKVLYWPLRLLARDVMPFIACNPMAALDVVPVDYVAEGIVACCRNDSVLGETIYLTAGEGHEVLIRDVLYDSYKYAGIKRVPVVPFWLFNSLRYTPLGKLFSREVWELAELARPYYSYLRGTRVMFAADKSQSLLAGLGIKPPSWHQYKREVLGFCHRSAWGKALPMPEYTYYLPASS